MLAQIYSLKGAANLLKTSNSEKSSFKLDDWEKDIISKLKTTHFGAAKTMMGIIFNKEKFRNIEIQTEDDGLSKFGTVLLIKFKTVVSNKLRHYNN